MYWILLNHNGHQQFENGDEPSVLTKGISFDRINQTTPFLRSSIFLSFEWDISPSEVIFTFKILDKNLYTCLISTLFTVGWDSVVDIATPYGLDGPGIESRWWTRFSAPFQTGR
jgi:hypothetical protein